MKNIFDSPKPLFGIDPEEFENIGAQLTSESSSVLSAPTGAGSANMTSLASSGGKLYALWRVYRSNVLTLEILRYSADGTYESAGDIIIERPTAPPSGFTVSDFTGLRGMTFYNNKIYFASLWRSSTATRSYILRYSLTGTYEAKVFDLPSTSITDDIDIDNNGNVIVSMRTGTSGSYVYSFKIYNITGTEQTSIPLTCTTTAAVGAVVVSTDRLYLNEGPNLRAYNTSTSYTTNPTRISSEDFNTTNAYRCGTSIGTTYYGLNITNDTIYRWTGIPVSGVQSPITASFGPLSYCSATRIFSSTITFSAQPVTFRISEFKIQKRSGSGTSGDPYSWTDETTGWTLTSGIGTTSRLITATPSNRLEYGTDMVEAGTYRIVLPINALATNQPSATVESGGQDLGDPVPKLVSETSSVLSSPPGASNMTAITSDGESLYTLWRRRVTLGADVTLLIRKYSAAGVYDSTGDIEINEPTDAPCGFSTNQFTGLRGMAFYDNKIYFVGLWRSTSPISNRSAILVYNMEGCYQSKAFDLPINSITDDIDIDNDGNIIISMVEGTVYSFKIYSISGTEQTSIPLTCTGTAAVGAVVISESRIYLNEGVNLKTYNTSISYTTNPTRIPLEDLNTIDTYRCGTSIGTTYYGLNITNHTVYRWTRIPFPNRPPSIDVTYSSPPRYNTVERSFRVIVTFKKHGLQTKTEPRLFSSLAFKIQKRSGIPQSYSYCDVSTGWTLIVGLGTTDREIIAIPDDSIESASYRIILPQNSFVQDQPNAPAYSMDQLVNPIPSITSTFQTPIYNPTTRVISVEVRFQDSDLPYADRPPRSFSITPFKVQKQSGLTNSYTWTDQSTGWTLTADTRIGARRTITATPDSTVNAGVYRIFIEANALTPEAPSNTQPSVDAHSSNIIITASVALAPLTYKPPSIQFHQPSGYNSNGISHHNGFIYILWENWSQRHINTGYLIRRYLIDGTYDPTGDISIGVPRIAPTGFSPTDLGHTYGFAIHDNEIYLGSHWRNDGKVIGIRLSSSISNLTSGNLNFASRPSSKTVSSITAVGSTPTDIWNLTFSDKLTDNEITALGITISGLSSNPTVTVTYKATLTTISKYSIDGSSNSIVLTLDPTDRTEGFDITNIDSNDDAIILSIETGTNNFYTNPKSYSVKAYNLSTGAEIRNISTNSTYGIAIGPTWPSGKRLYLSLRSGTISRTYDGTAYNRLVAGDTSTIDNFRSSTILTGILYGLSPQRNGRLSAYTGIPTQPISASFSTSTYNPTTRAITATVTFSSEPLEFSIAGFRVQQQTSAVVRIRLSFWVSGLCITNLNVTRPQTGLGTEKSEIGVRSWGAQPSTAWDVTFNEDLTTTEVNALSITITGLTNARGDPNNPIVQSITSVPWPDETEDWTVTATGTGVSKEISARPPQSLITGTYRITLPAHGMGTNQPILDINTATHAIAQIVASATWSNVSFTGGVNGKLQGTITFSGSNVTGVLISSFAVINNANPPAEQTGWSFDTISNSMISDGGNIIVATAPPANTSGSFGIRLKRHSISSGGGSGNAPAANVDTTIIVVDSRPQLSVSHFRAKLTTEAAERAATRELELDFDRDIDAAQLTVSDFSTTGGICTTTDLTISPTSGTEDLYTITVTQPITSRGTYTVTLAANAILGTNSFKPGPATAQTTVAISYDTRSPITVTSFNHTTGTTSSTSRVFSLVLSGSVSVTQLAVGDFTLTDTRTTGSGRGNLTLARTPTSGSASTYTVTVTLPTAIQGSFTLSLNRDAITTTNSDSYQTGPTAAVDTNPITTSYNIPARVSTGAWSAVSFCTDTQKLQGTMTFTGHAITDIQDTDFAVLDSSNTELTTWTFEAVSNTATAGTGITIVATAPANAHGTFKLRLKQGSVRSDGSTTDNAPAANVDSTGIAIDIRPALTATLAAKLTTIAAEEAGTREFTLTFSAVVPVGQLTSTDFAISDSNVTISNSFSPSSGSNSIYTITANQPSNRRGSYTLTLNANSISATTTYKMGPALAVSTAAVNYDRRPAVAVSSFGPKLTTSVAQRAATRELELDFDRDIDATQLAVGDFTTTNGASVTSISPTSGTEDIYTITVTQPTNNHGSYTITLAANAIPSSTSDTGYKQGPVSSVQSCSISYDTRPFVVAGANWSDVSLTGGKLQGTLTFTVTNPINNSNITGITASDFTVINNANPPVEQIIHRGTGTDSTKWSFDTPSISTTSGTGITISVTPPTNTNGTFKLRLSATSVRSDNSPSDNSPTNNADSTGVQIDNRPQLAVTSFIPTMTSSSGSRLTGTTATLTLTFDRAVPRSELTTDDFTVSNSAVTVTGISPNTNQSTYTVTVTHPTNASGSYTVKINANAISGASGYKPGPTTAFPATPTLSYYNVPAIVATANWSNESYTTPTQSAPRGKITATLTFSGAGITNIADSDFEVVNSSGIALTTWTFDTPSTTAIANTGITIGATPPNNTTNDSFKLRLKATSVRSDGSTTDNAPAANVDSSAISVDNRRIVATVTWSSVSFCTGNNKLQGTITFTTSSHNHSNQITGISANDFTVINSADAEVSWVFDTPSTTATSGNGIIIRATAPTNTDGTFKLRLKQTSVGSDGGTDNAPAANVDSTGIDIDIRPQLTVRSFVPDRPGSSGSPTTGTTETLTLTFDRSVPSSQLTSTNFTITDTRSTGTGRACLTLSISPTSGSQNTYTITVTRPTNSSGFYTVKINQNAISGTTTYKPGPTAAFPSTPTTSYYNIPAIIATATWETPSFSGGKLTAQLTFNGANITDIDDSDFIVLTNTDGTTTGWSFDTPNTSATAGSSITISATPPTNTNGTFKFRLNATSVGSDGGTDNAPAANVDSRNAPVDNRLQLMVSSFGLRSGTTTSDSTPTREFTLTFNTAVPKDQLTSADFDLPTNPTGFSISSISGTSGTSYSSYEIIINQPDNNSGPYNISLKANSIPGTTTYRPGPLSGDTVRTVSSISYDRRSPLDIVSFGLKPRTLTSASTATREFQITFNLPVPADQLNRADFESSNPSRIVLSISSPISPTSGDNRSYTITVDQPINYSSSYTLTLKANAIDASNSTTYLPINVSDPQRTSSPITNYDRRSIVSVVNNGFILKPGTRTTEETETREFELSFIQPILKTQLTNIDFTISNLTITIDSVTGLGSSPETSIFDITVNQPSNSRGDYIITLNANAIPDGISYRSGPISAVSTSPISYNTVRSNQAMKIADLGPPSVVQDGWSFEISDSTTPDTIIPEGTDRTIAAVAPLNTQGHFKLRIKPSSVRPLDKSVKDLPQMPIVSGSVPIDTREVEVFWSKVSGGTVLAGTLNLKNNDQVDASNISIVVINNTNPSVVQTGWGLNTISNIRPNGLITIIATPPTNTVGNFGIRFKKNLSLGIINNLDTETRFVNNLVLTLTNPTGGIVLRSQITNSSNRVLYNFNSSSFEVIAKDGQVLEGWTVEPLVNTLGPTQSGPVIATPPDDIDGFFKIRLKSLSVGTQLKIDGDNNPFTTRNTPSNIIESELTSTPVRSIQISWINPNWNHPRLEGTLSFKSHIGNIQISDLEPSDFEVRNSRNIVECGWAPGLLNNQINLDGNGNGTIQIQITPSIGCDEYYKIRIKRMALKIGGSQNGNLPRTHFDSSLVRVKNITITWNSIEWDRGVSPSKLVAILRLNPQIQMTISGLRTEDFEIWNNNTKQNNWNISILPCNNEYSITSNTDLTIFSTPPVNTGGRFKIRLKSKSITAGGLAIPLENLDSSFVGVDNRTNLIVATAGWSAVFYASGKLQGTMTFRVTSGTDPISGVETSDFEVLDSTDTPIMTGWSFDPISASQTTGTGFTVATTPPINTNGLFKLRLKMTSVQSGTSYIDNAPRANVDSTTISVDNT